MANTSGIDSPQNIKGQTKFNDGVTGEISDGKRFVQQQHETASVNYDTANRQPINSSDATKPLPGFTPEEQGQIDKLKGANKQIEEGKDKASKPPITKSDEVNASGYGAEVVKSAVQNLPFADADQKSADTTRAKIGSLLDNVLSGHTETAAAQVKGLATQDNPYTTIFNDKSITDQHASTGTAIAAINGIKTLDTLLDRNDLKPESRADFERIKAGLENVRDAYFSAKPLNTGMEVSQNLLKAAVKDGSADAIRTAGAAAMNINEVGRLSISLTSGIDGQQGKPFQNMDVKDQSVVANQTRDSAVNHSIDNAIQYNKLAQMA
ncbi:MAG: hypothetical protein LRY40_04710, partial [Shewanella fodinae]|nr:hypothetical protein [Shewanella fodinae]